jgi:hypothetical protein
MKEIFWLSVIVFDGLNNHFFNENDPLVIPQKAK